MTKFPPTKENTEAEVIFDVAHFAGKSCFRATAICSACHSWLETSFGETEQEAMAEAKKTRFLRCPWCNAKLKKGERR